MPSPSSNPSSRGAVGIGVYLVICFLAQLWPVAAVANRIEPRILGLPFLMFWYVAGVFAVFFGLAILYVRESGGKGG